MQPDHLATYMDMLRFLFMKEVRGHFRSVLQKHPDFEENIKQMRQTELKDARLLKLNAINKAEVMLFVLKDNEKTPQQSTGAKPTMTGIAANDFSSQSSGSRMRPDQSQNTCWKIHNKDKTVGPQWETLSAIRETLRAQRDEYEGAIVHKNQKFSTEQLGCAKTVYGILPGISMVKGFCSTMIIGELVEVLNSLLYPSAEEKGRSGSTENFRIRQPFDDEESQGSSMDMAFEDPSP